MDSVTTSAPDSGLSNAASSFSTPAVSSVAAERAQERPASLLAYPATYLLIAINVLVFAAMSRSGPVPGLLARHDYGGLLTAPFPETTLLQFGCSDPVRILMDGQWWRVVTSIFVHVTPLHILLNMWCLWNLGIFGEPLLGKPGLVAVYLLTGVAGMLQSLALSVFTRQIQRGDDVLVAGTSGAIFGIAGILIVLLSNRKLALPWEELRSLRRQVIFFALANLVLGIVPGVLPVVSPHYLRAVHLSRDAFPHIDNSAHIGGLLCGLALGWPLMPRMTSGRVSYRRRQAWVFAVAALALCLGARMLVGFWRADLAR